MAVSLDIVATWRRPRQVMRKLLDMGQREDRALMFLILACGLIFVAQLPPAMRTSIQDDSVPFQALMGGALFAWLFWVPLLAYLIAAMTRVIAMIFRGNGTWYSSRLALFWALLASSPAWLLYGLVRGFVGPGPAEQLTGAFLLLAFLSIWGICLREGEREPEATALT